MSNLTISDCLDVGEEFIFVNEQLGKHSEYLTLCRDLNATAARVQNKEEFNFLLAFFQRIGINGELIRLGMRKRENARNFRDPTLYEYSDKLGGNKDFFSDRGEFPWSAGQPNSGGTVSLNFQPCVEWLIGSSTEIKLQPDRWNDMSCNEKRKGLCRRNCTKRVVSTSNPTAFVTRFSPTLTPTYETVRTQSPTLDNQPLSQLGETEINLLFLGAGLFFFILAIVVGSFLRREHRRVKQMHKILFAVNQASMFIKTA